MFDRTAYQRNRRAARTAAGLCRYCGKLPPKPGRTECVACIESKAASQAALREARIRQGLCGHCGKRPPKATSLICAECTPVRKGTGAYEKKRRVGDIKYLSLVQPKEGKRRRRSEQSGHYDLVEIRSLGREFRKTFSFSKHQGNRSRAYLAALKWRDERLDALGIPKDSSAPFSSRPFKVKAEGEEHSTGVVGVSYHQPTKNKKGYFSASWRENKKMCQKTFAISKHGFEPALKAAIDYRREKIAEIYGKRTLPELRESFNDFLDQGEAYYGNGLKKESGTIAGVVFENTIRRMCDKYRIDESGKKQDVLISALSTEKKIKAGKAKLARVAAHVRTQATHAQWDEFELSEVKITLDLTRALIQEHLRDSKP